MDDFPAWAIKARKLEFLPFILLRTKHLMEIDTEGHFFKKWG